MIALDFSKIELKLRRAEGKTMVFDPVRKKWLVLTPEEHVRQHILQLFIEQMKYPAGLLSVEKTISVGGMSKRFDIVVYDREHQPWMLVECKAPDVPVTEKTLHQLLNYQSVIQGRYWLLTNGHNTFCADAGIPSEISWLTTLPQFV
jgi:hypothetical protein